jgi:hypothetical protein
MSGNWEEAAFTTTVERRTFGQQAYNGQQPTFVSNSVLHLTYDHSRYGISDGQIAVAGTYIFNTWNPGGPNAHSSPRKDGSNYADLVLPRTFSRLRLAKESRVFLDLFSDERGYGSYGSRFSVILMNMHMEGAGKRNLVR